MSRTSDIVDYLLGEGGDATRARVREAMDTDLAMAVEVAQTRDLFERMRGLSVPSSGNVPLAIRFAIQRRLELRRLRRLGVRDTVQVALRVAAVAILWLYASNELFGPRHADRADRASEPIATASPAPVVGIDQELESLLAAGTLPVADPGFRRSYESFADAPLPEGFAGWVSADNSLARLRAEYELRFSASARRAARRATGTPNLEDRVDSLANTVAERVQADLELRVAAPRDVALALRGLLAVGSTASVGPHRHAVSACLEMLAERVPQLGGGELATALSALTELAVVEGGTISRLVATHADRLARDTLRTNPSGRPALLSWQTQAASLADAGRVFQLAPAFGVPAALAFRARVLVAAHVGERLQRRGEDLQPEVVAAWLYGFGDLIDRQAADRKLALWRPRLLLPNYVALHHFAWSKHPVRAGWATFQQELRGLAGEPTPAGTRDAAALLLCLSTNQAAPGALEATRLAQI